jgi:hypothetical protein
VTVHPGETTTTILANTRTSSEPGTNRKAIINTLADTIFARLQALPAAQWVPMLKSLEGIAQDRLMLAWFKDSAAQGLIEGTNVAGAVRQDPGDYLMLVDANVSPASKFNLAVTRSTALDVTLADDGSASSTLHVAYQNDAGKPGEPYESLRRYSVPNGENGLYGTYVRALMPAGSDLVNATGDSLVPVSGAEGIDTEAGRTAFGNYLLVPEQATLDYAWHTPPVVLRDGDQWGYTLTIQKQPGMLPEPVTVRIAVPPGTTITGTSDGLVVDGATAAWSGSLTEDIQLWVTYR